MHIFTNANYNFTRWRWHALALSSVVILAGIAMIVARGGMPVGIDFSGGTIVVVKFDQTVTEEQVRRSVLVSSDLGRLTQQLHDLIDLGFDEVYLHHVGQEQSDFIDTFGARVLPELGATPKETAS